MVLTRQRIKAHRLRMESKPRAHSAATAVGDDPNQTSAAETPAHQNQTNRVGHAKASLKISRMVPIPALMGNKTVNVIATGQPGSPTRMGTG